MRRQFRHKTVPSYYIEMSLIVRWDMLYRGLQLFTKGILERFKTKIKGKS
jgi:hypothetical protein